MAKNAITNEDRENFFSRFNEPLLIKIGLLKAGKSASRNYRANLELDKAFIKKLKEFKNQNLSKTDVIEAGIAQFVYGDAKQNVLTAKGAIKIISKGDSIINTIAKLALEDEGEIKDFVDYIKDQANEGNKEALIATHGKDVINAILNN